jgi:hypothetical protein
MSTSANSYPQPQTFTRRSDSESICMSCFLTVRADGYTPLEVAENIHTDVCLMNPLGSPVRYALD